MASEMLSPRVRRFFSVRVCKYSSPTRSYRNSNCAAGKALSSPISSLSLEVRSDQRSHATYHGSKSNDSSGMNPSDSSRSKVARSRVQVLSLEVGWLLSVGVKRLLSLRSLRTPFARSQLSPLASESPEISSLTLSPRSTLAQSLPSLLVSL